MLLTLAKETAFFLVFSHGVCYDEKNNRKRKLNMKRIIMFVLLVCMLVCSACAEPFIYTQESVTDSANTHIKYDPFYAKGELSVLVPGLKQGFVPQGLSYLPQKNWMIIAGYSGNENTNSAIFAVDLATGEMVREVMLKYADGSDYDGHAGGSAVTEKNIFIAIFHGSLSFRT